MGPNAIHQITSCSAYDILKEKKKVGRGVLKHNSDKPADEIHVKDKFSIDLMIT